MLNAVMIIGISAVAHGGPHRRCVFGVTSPRVEMRLGYCTAAWATNPNAQWKAGRVIAPVPRVGIMRSRVTKRSEVACFHLRCNGPLLALNAQV